MAAKTYAITASNNIVSITASDGVLDRDFSKQNTIVNEVDADYIQILKDGIEVFKQKYTSISDIGGGGAPASQNAARVALTSLLSPDSIIVTLGASGTAAGGLSIDSQIQTSAAVLTTVVKASAGRLGFIACYNSGSAAAYLKVYNKATTPSSSDTPIYRAVIPANNSTGSGFIQPIIIGVTCNAGISYRVTGGIADNDTTALTANTILVNIAYS